MQHHTIICDECGTFPIDGVRYKSTNIYDHDCCEQCWLDNHANESTFVSFEKPVPYQDAKDAGPPSENRIRAMSAKSAEEQLRNGRSAPLAIFGFHNEPTPEECQAVTSFINRNAFLTKIELHMTNKFITYEDTIAILVEGLIQSKSLKMIAWTMPCSARKSPQNAASIKKLIERIKGLEILLFLRMPYRLGCGCCENEFACAVFEGLKKNRTIKTFRFDPCSQLSKATKKVAWKAVESNSSLMRLHTNFEHCEGDHHINMLTAFNRNPKWIHRWTDLAATNEDRIRVLGDIISDHVDSEQDIHFLFHLFQTYPPVDLKV